MTKAVALEIWSHAEGRHQSTYSVAEALGINRRTAASAIAELQEHGWLLREIHTKIGPSGRARTAWERWHLQMSNTPFTPDRCTQYTTTGAPSTPVPVHPVHYIGVQGEVHEKCTSTGRSEEESVHPVHRSGEGARKAGTPLPRSVGSEAPSLPRGASFTSLSFGEPEPGGAVDAAPPPSSLATSASSSGGRMADPFDFGDLPVTPAAAAPWKAGPDPFATIN
jgi:hypothetical protein